MTTQNLSLLTLSVALTGTVTANRFVTPAGAQAGADANTLGVSRVGGVSGDVAPVDVMGTAIVEAGAAISAGATVKANASGKAITWATSGAKVGVALEAAAGDGSMVEILLIPNAA
jgi:hypothetical protein